MARYFIRNTEAIGGVHVRISPFDQRVMDIKFFDQYGLDINKTTERKIENLFFREDFRRVYLDDIGAIEVLSERWMWFDRYLEGFYKAVDCRYCTQAQVPTGRRLCSWQHDAVVARHFQPSGL